MYIKYSRKKNLISAGLTELKYGSQIIAIVT